MKSLLASVRAGGGLDRADHAALFLDDLKKKLGEVSLERLWGEYERGQPADTANSHSLLVECVKLDLRARFEAGESPHVTEYLERFPQLQSASSRVLSLIYEEYCLVEQRGVAINVDSFCERYPAWKDSLVSQLQYHHLFSQATGLSSRQPEFPEVGQLFEEFQLISVIGKGGTSRVFLANDLALGGKQVVLKVSLDRGQEPQAQGALDHPHIVPVNSVVFDEHELRGLSMPFRPGRPLDEIIKDVSIAQTPRRAIDLWKALVEAENSLPSPRPEFPTQVEPAPDLPRGDGWAGFPIRGTYYQGAAWIAMIIARALQYAHERRTFHRDVKPGNILLTIHYGPQLFDFNLAASPHSVQHAELAMNGGTLPYMAPEQIHAFIIPELWKEVHAPADIYSLGLVLRELLIGLSPELPTPGLSAQQAIRSMLDRRPFIDISLRRHNPAIPVALEVIVARCLAFAPEDRYATSEDLADDLQRFLDHRPLKTAVNTSQTERFSNWCRRNRPQLSVSSVLVGCALLAFVPSAIESLKPPLETRAQFHAGVRALERHDLIAASNALRPLESAYPKSSGLQLCLALLDSITKNPSQASHHFRHAITTPRSLEQLQEWAKRHPGLVPDLVSFGEQSLEDLGNDEKRLSDALEAVSIALAVAPNSPDARQVLARCQENSGDFSAAYKSISAAIDGAALEDRPVSSEDLFEYRLIHIRLATKLATDLQQKNGLGASRESLEYLDQAKKSINICQAFCDGAEVTHSRRYYYSAIKLEAMLVRSEIEIGLGQTSRAAHHIQEVDGLFKRVRELAAICNSRLPEKSANWLIRSKKVTEQLRATTTASVLSN